MQRSNCIEFFPGFHGLCENPYIHAVCRISNRLDKELIVGFEVDVAGVAASNLKILNSEIAQVAE